MEQNERKVHWHVPIAVTVGVVIGITLGVIFENLTLGVSIGALLALGIIQSHDAGWY